MFTSPLSDLAQLPLKHYSLSKDGQAVAAPTHSHGSAVVGLPVDGAVDVVDAVDLAPAVAGQVRQVGVSVL